MHGTSREPEGTTNCSSINSRVYREPPQPACFDTAVTFANKCHKRILELVKESNLQLINTYVDENTFSFLLTCFKHVLLLFSTDMHLRGNTPKQLNQ